MEERTFKITEEELNKIFNFITSKPINEAIEVYGICIEVGKRSNIEHKPEKDIIKDESKDKS